MLWKSPLKPIIFTARQGRENLVIESIDLKRAKLLYSHGKAELFGFEFRFDHEKILCFMVLITVIYRLYSTLFSPSHVEVECSHSFGVGLSSTTWFRVLPHYCSCKSVTFLQPFQSLHYFHHCNLSHFYPTCFRCGSTYSHYLWLSRSSAVLHVATSVLFWCQHI